jgi:uncharacterized membrane protein YeaQ/YmgE (transglycosylase-associated protein family)
VLSGACYPAAVTPWWGAIAWSGAGLLLAVALRLLPPWRATSWLLTLAVGLSGAALGGTLATVLGFGGLAALDPRSLATAALAALLALLLLALARVSASAGAGRAGVRPRAR